MTFFLRYMFSSKRKKKKESIHEAAFFKGHWIKGTIDV